MNKNIGMWIMKESCFRYEQKLVYKIYLLPLFLVLIISCTKEKIEFYDFEESELPVLSITLDDSKDDIRRSSYKNGGIEIDGIGLYDNLSTNVEI